MRNPNIIECACITGGNWLLDRMDKPQHEWRPGTFLNMWSGWYPRIWRFIFQWWCNISAIYPVDFLPKIRCPPAITAHLQTSVRMFSISLFICFCFFHPAVCPSLPHVGNGNGVNLVQQVPIWDGEWWGEVDLNSSSGLLEASGRDSVSSHSRLMALIIWTSGFLSAHPQYVQVKLT